MYAPWPSVLAAPDSARVVGDIYGASLAATVPLLVVAIAAFWLRRSSAETRVIVWRCAVASLIVICAGRFMPWAWMAWVLPELLARPLIALGTGELGVRPSPDSTTGSATATIRWLLMLYWSGVGVVLVRTFVARARLAIVRQNARTLTSGRWRKRLRAAGDAIGLPTDRVALHTSRDVRVPMTWGITRPVIVLPREAERWPGDRVQAVLRHELAHIRSRDAASRLATRIACALFWFHPGVWWLARRFEIDAETACDDRVLLSGIRASDYAEWLALSTRSTGLRGALAFARLGTLRTRLANITDTGRRIQLPGPRAMFGAAVVTALLIVPVATARLAPTRDVLTSLMLETRWESRAWAVVRLAQRADSVEVARTAARHDPDPSVRAWARYALARVPVTPVTRPRS